MADSQRTNDAWPPELDALRAAPEHHELLMENDQVRVLRTRIPAGETTAVHSHRWPAVYLIEGWSPFVRRDANGEVTLDSRTVQGLERPAGPIWSPPLPPHTLENVGDAEIRLVSVEVKAGG